MELGVAVDHACPQGLARFDSVARDRGVAQKLVGMIRCVQP